MSMTVKRSPSRRHVKPPQCVGSLIASKPLATWTLSKAPHTVTHAIRSCLRPTMARNARRWLSTFRCCADRGTGPWRAWLRRWRFHLTAHGRQLFFCQELVEDALLVPVVEPVEYGGLFIVGGIAQLSLELEQKRYLMRMLEDRLRRFRYRRVFFFLLLGRKASVNNFFFRALSLARIYRFGAGGGRSDLCSLVFSFPFFIGGHDVPFEWDIDVPFCRARFVLEKEGQIEKTLFSGPQSRQDL